MASIKYKIQNNEVTIPLFEELDAEKTIRAKVEDKNYLAGLTSNLADMEATSLRTKIGGKTYAFLKTKPRVIRISDGKHKMSAFYPDTYQQMETVPDTILGSENVKYFNEMFADCKNLKIVPALDTSKGYIFDRMFYGCEKIQTIPWFDMSNGGNQHFGPLPQMFYGCSSLTTIPSLDFKGFNSFLQMFYKCSSLRKLPAMDTSGVYSFEEAFFGCRNLYELEGLDTSKCTNFWSMFDGCSGLTKIPQLDTSHGKNFYSMFAGCQKLPSTFPWTIDLTSVTEETTLNNMFAASSVRKVKFKNVKEELKSKITPKLLTFSGNIIIEFEGPIQLSAEKYKMSTVYPDTYTTMENVPDVLLGSENLTDFTEMFKGCSNLVSAPELDIEQGKNIRSMFHGCKNLKNIPVLDTSSAVAFEDMFNGCRALPSEFPWPIDLSAVVTESMLSNMFVGSSVTKVKFKNVSESVKKTITAQLLKGSGKLTIEFLTPVELTTRKYKMSQVYPDNYTTLSLIPDAFKFAPGIKKIDRMYDGCKALTNIPKMDTSSFTSLSFLFNGCENLKKIPELSTSKCTNFRSMFNGCISLPAEFPWPIDLSAVTSATYLLSMFAGSSVTKVKFKNVRDELKEAITSLALKGDETLEIEYEKVEG